MTRKTQAVVFKKPGQIALKTFELPDCGPKEVIAETIYSFVSPGTELRVLSGIEDWVKPNFPFIPGYSWVGRIIEVGSELNSWQKGDLVTGRNPLPIPRIKQLWGGQASHHRCEVTGYDSVLKLPQGANPWEYITTEVASISWRGVSIAFPAIGETAVIIGQGLIGAFGAKWLMYHGARVIVVDIVPSRLERARKWGVAAALDGRDPNIRQLILDLTDGGADIVIESSASKVGVELASSIVRQPWPKIQRTNYPVESLHANAHIWPRLVYQAGYTCRCDVFPGDLTGGEGTLVLKPGDRMVGDRLQVIEQIRRGNLPVADIIDKPTPVSDAPQAYLELRDHPERVSAVAYKWQ